MFSLATPIASSTSSLESGLDLTATEPLAAAHTAVPLQDDWETRDRLRDIEALLQRPPQLGLVPRCRPLATPGTGFPKLVGFPHDTPPNEPHGHESPGKEEEAPADGLTSGFFWAALCLMAAFLSGGLAWLYLVDAP